MIVVISASIVNVGLIILILLLIKPKPAWAVYTQVFYSALAMHLLLSCCTPQRNRRQKSKGVSPRFNTDVFNAVSGCDERGILGLPALQPELAPPTWVRSSLFKVFSAKGGDSVGDYMDI